MTTKAAKALEGILRLSMGIASKALCALSLLAAAHCAAALEVDVDNQSDSEVVLAFSYMEKGSGNWMVEGWYNVAPKSQGKVDLNTDNSLYYLYAEFSNGKRIEGGEGSVRLKVLNRSFSYAQDKDPGRFSREASFVRARGNGGKATIRIK